MFVNIANGLIKRGHTVDLVTVQASGPFAETLHADVNIYELGGGNSIQIVPRLVKYLRNRRPDALLSTNEMMNLIALFSRRISGVGTRVVIRISSINSRRERRSPKDKLIPRLQNVLYSWADEIVAISEGVREDIVSQAGVEPDRVKVIYNPVFSTGLVEDSRGDPDHPWFQESDPVVLGVGRLEEEKDFSTLIKALHEIGDDIPARLIILGEGKQRSELLDLSETLQIRDRVSLPGFVDNPYPYMREADVFVLSSKSEGFGNVLVEAMATGTPVVSTDCPGGPSEILGEGDFGSLVPVGDAKAMGRAISKQVEDPVCAGKLTKRARDFSRQQAVKEYENTLRS